MGKLKQHLIEQKRLGTDLNGAADETILTEMEKNNVAIRAHLAKPRHYTYLQLAIGCDDEEAVRYLVEEVKVNVNKRNHPNNFTFDPPKSPLAVAFVRVVQPVGRKWENNSKPAIYNLLLQQGAFMDEREKSWVQKAIDAKVLTVDFKLGEQVFAKKSHTNDLHKAAMDENVARVKSLLVPYENEVEYDIRLMPQLPADHEEPMAHGDQALKNTFIMTQNPAGLFQFDENGNKQEIFNDTELEKILNDLKISDYLTAELNAHEIKSIKKNLTMEGKLIKLERLITAKGGHSLFKYINRPDCFGYTPIHYAVKENHTKVVELLVEKGADLNLVTDHGDTPLHIAVENKCLKSVEALLLNFGRIRDIDAKNAAEQSALLILYGAAEKLSFNIAEGWKNIFIQLITNGAEVKTTVGMKLGQAKIEVDDAQDAYRRKSDAWLAAEQVKVRGTIEDLNIATVGHVRRLEGGLGRHERLIGLQAASLNEQQGALQLLEGEQNRLTQAIEERPHPRALPGTEQRRITSSSGQGFFPPASTSEVVPVPRGVLEEIMRQLSLLREENNQLKQRMARLEEHNGLQAASDTSSATSTFGAN